MSMVVTDLFPEQFDYECSIRKISKSFSDGLKIKILNQTICKEQRGDIITPKAEVATDFEQEIRILHEYLEEMIPSLADALMFKDFVKVKPYISQLYHLQQRASRISSDDNIVVRDRETIAIQISCLAEDLQQNFPDEFGASALDISDANTVTDEKLDRTVGDLEKRVNQIMNKINVEVAIGDGEELPPYDSVLRTPGCDTGAVRKTRFCANSTTYDRTCDKPIRDTFLDDRSRNSNATPAGGVNRSCEIGEVDRSEIGSLTQKLEQLSNSINNIESFLNRDVNRSYRNDFSQHNNSFSSESKQSKDSFSSQTRSNGKPVHQWKLTFSGEGGLSANDFLDSVSILQNAEKVSDQDMLSSVFHLLQGSALRWYREKYYGFESWRDFQRKFREQYLPPHYDELLLQEIDTRLQGEDESFASYNSAMALILRLE